MTRDTRTVPVPLALLRFSTSPDAIDEGCCLACDAYLDLHQPDAGSPEWLVGVCGRCGHWYLIDLTPETDEGLMTLLPGAGGLRDARASGVDAAWIAG